MDKEKQQLMEKLVASGEKERLKQLLKQKLIECGWKDNVRTKVQGRIQEKGIENVSVDSLLNDVMEFAQRNVPENVKKELMNELTKVLETE